MEISTLFFRFDSLVLFHNIVDEVFQNLCGMLYLLPLLVCQGNLDRLGNSIRVNYAGDTDAGTFQLFSVLLAQYMSHRKYGILILENGFYNPESGHGDSVEGCALQGDNVRAAGLCLQCDSVLYLLLLLRILRQEMVDGLACYVDTAPDRYLAVSVLTQDITLNITDIYVRTLA